MSASWLLILLLVLAGLGFFLGRSRALSSADGDVRKLHSLPNYYGFNVAMLAFVPAVLLLGIWVVAQPMVIDARASGEIPASMFADEGELNLIMSDVRRVAEGLDLAVGQGVLAADAVRALDTTTTDLRELLGGVGVALGSEVAPEVLAAAQKMHAMTASGNWVMTALVLAAGLGGFIIAVRMTSATLRARNMVESGILTLLIGAATIAILTTVGIVLSLIFNTVNFFGLFPATDFLFGTTWSPEGRGGSEHLGILPLLWGTIYISIIALLVAVPIGLFRRRLPVGICQPRNAQLREAPAGGAGGHSHHRLRPVCPNHRRPDAGRCLWRGWAGVDAGHAVGHDRRSGHGHHAHPLRLVAV